MCVSSGVVLSQFLSDEEELRLLFDDYLMRLNVLLLPNGDVPLIAGAFAVAVVFVAIAGLGVATATGVCSSHA